MATSGSINFTQTRDELIKDAFDVLGVYGIGETVTAEDNAFAVRLLNKMIKAWGTKELHLWTKNEAILFLQPTQEKYTLGGSTSHYCSDSSGVVTRKLSAAASASATSLSLDSTSDMTVSDYIGVVTSDKTVHWTTIATIPTSTTLTLTSGLDSAANNAALVYVFTTKINKPLKVLDIRRRTGYNNISSGVSSEVDLNLTLLPHSTYYGMPVKGSPGDPTQAYYQPNLLSGDLYLWPRPNDGSTRIVFTYERIIEDMDQITDNFDFPDEWLEALTYQLAVRLARPFGKAAALVDILPLASTMLTDLLNWDNEKTNISMEQDNDY